MHHKELLNLLNAEPFQPFRIHVSDGSSIQIDHPDQAIVTAYKVLIGVGGSGHFAERVEHCSLIHITRLEETPLVT